MAAASLPAVMAKDCRLGPLYLCVSVVCTHAVTAREGGDGETRGPGRGKRGPVASAQSKTVNNVCITPSDKDEA